MLDDVERLVLQSTDHSWVLAYAFFEDRHTDLHKSKLFVRQVAESSLQNSTWR
jgi:hypothetical protein